MTNPPPATPTPSPSALAASPSLEVPPTRRPRHIAVIMDGNGRWALERQRSRIEGHRAGARTVREVVTECGRLGIEALTMFSFSSENWKRPTAEVDALMELCLEYLVRQRQELLDNNVRFRQIGRRRELPRSVQAEIEETEAATRDSTGLTLVLALNYGARTELTDATRAIASAVKDGRLSIDDIDETTIADHLYTAGLPDPDLLIRTAGEYRVSNYLLWQISYAEIHVTDVYWPEFTRAHLHDAIRDFAGRDRRFGALTDEG
ncbi:MAG: isoprenyl transferase [Phycisphaerae bacterium]|nr:isoprenyl transferase [Phycisphaerae bacterium]NNF42495.1 isoprenyl transferase [Phycisphaerales bacterium]